MRDRDRVFLDTNILVYLANEDSPFHPATLIKFKEVALSHEIWISRQVLREYAVVMTRQGFVEKPLSPEDVAMDIKQWSTCFKVADETESVTDLLLEMTRDMGVASQILNIDKAVPQCHADPGSPTPGRTKVSHLIHER